MHRACHSKSLHATNAKLNDTMEVTPKETKDHISHPSLDLVHIRYCKNFCPLINCLFSFLFYFVFSAIPIVLQNTILCLDSSM